MTRIRTGEALALAAILVSLPRHGVAQLHQAGMAVPSAPWWAAVVGVSALIAASPTAFTALKIAGGAYLIWLGIRAIRSSGKIELKSSEVESGTTFSFFLKGIFANAINPKVILFFLSFLPQFVIAQNGAVTWQIAALGVTFTVQAAILFTLLGYFSGYVGQWLAANRRVGLWLDRLAGAVFVGLGLRLVLAR